MYEVRAWPCYKKSLEVFILGYKICNCSLEAEGFVTSEMWGFLIPDMQTYCQDVILPCTKL